MRQIDHTVIEPSNRVALERRIQAMPLSSLELHLLVVERLDELSIRRHRKNNNEPSVPLVYEAEILEAAGKYPGRLKWVSLSPSEIYKHGGPMIIGSAVLYTIAHHDAPSAERMTAFLQVERDGSLTLKAVESDATEDDSEEWPSFE